MDTLTPPPETPPAAEPSPLSPTDPDPSRRNAYWAAQAEDAIALGGRTGLPYAVERAMHNAYYQGISRGIALLDAEMQRG